MPSASGADIKIGSYEFLLARDMEEHYVYEEAYDHLPQELDGTTSKVDIDRDERLLWRMSDWSGGEGARSFDPSNPTVYDYSEDTSTSSATLSGSAVNPRVAGQITGRPYRTRDTVSTLDVTSKPWLVVAEGRLWTLGDRHVKFSTNVATWTAIQDNLGMDITAVGGGDDVVYFASGNGTNSRIQYADHSMTASNAPDVIAVHGRPNPWREKMVVVNGHLYAWTGRKLHEVDVNEKASFPLAFDASPGYRTILDTGTSDFTNGNYGGSSDDSWWVDVVGSENSIFAMLGTRGQTRVWRGRLNESNDMIVRPYWTSPIGFSGKSMVLQQGVLFVAGHWGGESTSGTGKGSLYAIPLSTNNPLFAAWVRGHTNSNLQMQEVAASYSNQIMVAAANQGKIFIYDLEKDAITLLDDLPYTFSGSNKKVGSMATYGPYRVAITYEPRASSAAGSWETWIYGEDEDTTSREYSTASIAQAPPIFMPWHDFNLPYERKSLIGFHLIYEVEDDSTASGLKAGQSIVIKYTKDNASYQTLTALASGDTPVGSVKGRHFFAVSSGSSTVKFNRLKYQVIPTATRTGGNDYQAPIITDVTVEARSLDSDKTWTLKVRVKDDIPNTRLRNTNRTGRTARDLLRAAKQNNDILTFLDYYRYQSMPQARNTASTHTVIVHAIRDVITEPGEGIMEVVLKAVRT